MITEVLLFLITVMVTSGVVLLLVQQGILSVRADVLDEPLLNTEFIPFERGGELHITKILFCDAIDEQFTCEHETNLFKPGQNVYVLFVAQSSTSNHDIMLVRNYRLLNPGGSLLVESDEKNTYHIDITSDRDEEQVVFSNYFGLPQDAVVGEYTLDVIVENPLLQKKVMVRTTFRVDE